MEGTPEGEALRRELRLARDDVDYLGLDEFRTYLDTDLRDDEELVGLLERCGCGHLLGFSRASESGDPAPGQAAMMRHYLGLAATAGEMPAPAS